MKAFPATRHLTVQLDGGSGQAPIPIGRMVWDASRRTSLFEFDARCIADRLDLSPIALPLKPGSFAAPSAPFEGLFGLFADSLPDGWGRRLTDKRLIENNFDPSSLTSVDRLALIGQDGMGALTYVPDASFPKDQLEGQSLEALEVAADIVDRDIGNIDLARLDALNGGSAGARPKVMLHIDAHGGYYNRSSAGSHAWVVKFASRMDPPEIGAIEAAYAIMAKEAGVTMAETGFIPALAERKYQEGKLGYFATKRFDRVGTGPNAQRVHMHTAAGLLHADFRQPQIDYTALLLLTRKVTRSQEQVEQQFRRAVFNVLAGNRDDHAKNHAFLFNMENRVYQISPAYDLTPSSGVGGEHNLAVNGKGRGITPEDAIKLAESGGIRVARARTIIEEVASAVIRWSTFCDEFRIGPVQRSEIGLMLNACLEPFGHRFASPTSR
jgi:serine/threonine-protein kinase HipA